MFGTLKPHTCELKGSGRELEWRRFYCGTCKSLGDHFGQPHRALLSHDAVLIAILVDALQAEAGTPDSCRCPLMPIQHRPTVTSSSVSVQYAAALQLLLADQWLADRQADGRRLPALARPLTQRPVQRARAIFQRLGVHLDDLHGFEHRQHDVELQRDVTVAEAAQPTADALALIFTQLADLPGTAEDALTAQTRRALERLGRNVGAAIYLIDALEDLRKDALEGAFNPCLARDAEGALLPDPDRVRDAIALLDLAMDAINQALIALPLRRHRALLRHILVAQLGRQAARATTLAHERASEAERAHLQAWRAKPWIERAALQAAALAAVLWVWLQSLPQALAQPTRRRRRALDDSHESKHDRENIDKNGGKEAPERPSDEGGTTGGEGSGGEGSGGESGEGGLGTGGGEGTGGEGGGTGGSGDGTGSGDCGDCFSCCEVPGKICKDCGDSCGGFCDICNDCGKCCDGCKDCGNCCDGCNNCGNGCNDCGNCCNGCNYTPPHRSGGMT